MKRTLLESGRLEEKIPDLKPLMSLHEAKAEASRCLYCSDAPCIQSCPTTIDIPEFIRSISTENLRGSAKTILSSNILGHSCARVCPVDVLCEGSCVYNELKERPVSIGRLQRFATEYVYTKDEALFEAGPDTGKKVAVIGAGPAGLACAHELRIAGHAVTIFEAREIPGGLNTSGIAPYKLHANDALKEVDYITSIGGIDIKYNTALGKDITLEEIEKDFDATFIGVGLGEDSLLNVDGKDLEGVIGAVEWIEHIKINPGYTIPEGVDQVVVVGGGNTALDVMRETLLLDIKDVTLVYRRNEPSMTGYSHEWKEAKLKGAKASWCSMPIEIKGENGKVTAVRCQETRLVESASGRQRVEIVEGSEFEIPCQMVMLAIGQGTLGEVFAGVEGIEVSGGCVVIDAETGQTGNPRYFAGGDCTNGGKEVVNAAAEGKLAAQHIDTYLRSN